ncbi:unnamed protein product [Didymodactylos carnosus]|uniref:NADP-dependent oxidoreductase domain-containing protein n=2 Tax=Didymodactylos carnosus TaxID=1234261 RepID=A0A815F333_9BILA|nr:unnamed protein product [Didymodactylos carnosus]CAF4165931.1 unnamed protein product [Didymodactylos carnosus]
MSNVPLLTLSTNNASIPQIAFGTGTAWYRGNNESDINQTLVDSIKAALQMGYRHLDAAEVYGTEKDVGEAIKQYLTESKEQRSSLFVTTKVFVGLGNVQKAADDSLKRLQLDYVDLYLVHAPFSLKEKFGVTLKEVWQHMEQLLQSGKVKNIGVSNFRLQDVEELLSFAKVKPCVNQIEFHPYVNAQSKELLEYCKKNKILIASYAPLASIIYHKDGPVDPIIEELAKKYGKSHVHILLKWNMSKGNVVITTSSKPDRLKSYLTVGDEDFKLTDDDIRKIDEAGAKLYFRKYWTEEMGGKTSH